MKIGRLVYELQGWGWACVVAVCCAGIGCDGSDRPGEGLTELPRIDLAGLRGLIEESDLEGRVLVVDFWATWCGPCVENFGRVHGRLKGLGDRVRVVSVTLDVPGEAEGRAVAFLKEHSAIEGAYLLVPDRDARLRVVAGVGERWKDLVVPAILVYGLDGELAGEYLGEEAVDVEMIVAALDRLLD